MTAKWGLQPGGFCPGVFDLLLIGTAIEILLKFLEAIPEISSIATNIIKLPFQKWQTLGKMSCYWAEEYAT